MQHNIMILGGKERKKKKKEKKQVSPGLEPGTSSVLTMCHNQLDYETFHFELSDLTCPDLLDPLASSCFFFFLLSFLFYCFLGAPSSSSSTSSSTSSSFLLPPSPSSSSLDFVLVTLIPRDLPPSKKICPANSLTPSTPTTSPESESFLMIPSKPLTHPGSLFIFSSSFFPTRVVAFCAILDFAT